MYIVYQLFTNIRSASWHNVPINQHALYSMATQYGIQDGIDKQQGIHKIKLLWGIMNSNDKNIRIDNNLGL